MPFIHPVNFTWIWILEIQFQSYHRRVSLRYKIDSRKGMKFYGNLHSTYMLKLVCNFNGIFFLARFKTGNSIAMWYANFLICISFEFHCVHSHFMCKIQNLSNQQVKRRTNQNETKKPINAILKFQQTMQLIFVYLDLLWEERKIKEPLRVFYSNGNILYLNILVYAFVLSSPLRTPLSLSLSFIITNFISTWVCASV